MSTDFLSTEMSPVKEANKTPAPPVIKKSLPEEIYPGVPIEETPAAEAAAGEPTAGIGSEAPPTEKENEQAEKHRVGSIIFKVLYVLNLYFIAKAFYAAVLVFSEMEKAGVEPKIINLLFGLFLFIVPLFFTVLLSGFTRLLVGSAAEKNVTIYISIMTIYNYWAKIMSCGFAGGTFFVPSLAISAFAAKSILTYNGGGFFRHCKNTIKHSFHKQNLFVKLFDKSKK